MSTVSFMTGLGVVCAIAATVLAFIFVLPEDKCKKMPKIFMILHNILNFKSLMIETIMKALYIFATAACVLVGFFMLFGFEVYNGYYSSHTTWYGGYGLLLMLLGPIVVRLVFESIMMFILLVKNTIQINNKLGSKSEKEDDVVFQNNIDVTDNNQEQ